jgi:hypothetical protein
MATTATAATVTITAPANGATVSGTVNITVEVSTAYTSANIYVDGGYFGDATPNTTPPHTFRLDTRTLANGAHTILAAAFYGDDNGTTFLGQDSITVTVNNIVKIIAPSDGATISGTRNITIQVSAPYTNANIYFDGGHIGDASPSSTPPHTLSLDTTQRTNGPHTIHATAFFSDDNGTILVGQDTITITIDNTAPSLDMYGGRNDVSCTGGTKPHFYREKIGNRWWLCTPHGHGFISISAYAVSWTGLDQGRLNEKYGTGGPSANENPKYNWAHRMAQRYGSWGFNSYADYTDHGGPEILPWVVNPNAWSTPDHTIPIKMPHVMVHKSSSAAQRNLGNHAAGPAKGWRVGLKHVLDLGNYYLPYMDGVDYFDPNWLQYTDNSLANDSWFRIQRAVNSDWLLGVSFDDLDHIKFAGPGDAFPTVVHGQPQAGQAQHTPHWGLLTLIASPVHSVDNGVLNSQIGGYVPLFQDEVFHAKQTFINWLQQTANKGPGYPNIQALNASWGLGACGSGGYCSFATQAVARTEQLCPAPGHWDGVRYQCTQTLGSPPSPLTLRVKQAGNLIGGDDAAGYHPAPGGPLSPTGLFWGSGLNSGFDSVNYATRVVSITFAQAHNSAETGWYLYPDKITRSDLPPATLQHTPVAPGMVTVQAEGPYYCQDDGNGNLVKYTGPGPTRGDQPFTCQGTINYLTGQVANLVITPAFTGQWVNINYATPQPPAAGSAPTIDYKSGGWGSGFGLADEDGTCPARGSNACWMPAASWTLAGINPNMKRDLDNFFEYYAARAFGGEREAIQRSIPGALLFCNSGSYDTPAHAPVLKAMGQYCDVALDSSAFSQVDDMVARYNYFIENTGDVPIGSWEGFGVNEDSHLWDPAIPVEQRPQTEWMKTSPPIPSPRTQEQRAVTYAEMLNDALNTRDSTYNSYHFVAWKWWALVDTPNEGYNWGLIDRLDNAYDGHETTTGSVACSPPVQAYTCGSDNGNWGNFLGAVTTANKMWLSLPPN